MEIMTCLKLMSSGTELLKGVSLTAAGISGMLVTSGKGNFPYPVTSELISERQAGRTAGNIEMSREKASPQLE